MNAVLDTGQPGNSAPSLSAGPMNHLPPVILLPETAVHLASLPPSTYHPGLLSFILFSGHSAVSANYCHRFFVNQLGSSRGTSLILSPVRALASSLNGICQQLDRCDRQEMDPYLSSISLGLMLNNV